MRHIRSYQSGDGPALGRIFHTAVHEGARDAYGEEERAAWSPAPPDGPAWEKRLAEADTVVALDGSNPIGFMSLVHETGYLDLAFVLPEVTGQGVASSLYAVLESRARAAGLARLRTEASHLAEPLFKARGWHVVKRQRVLRRGVEIANAIMEKDLGQGGTAMTDRTSRTKGVEVAR